MWLRQSTAVDIALGPFVDATDGVTAETGLTISQADVRLKKNNGAWAQKNDTNSATHEEAGWYEVPLNTTDTNTLGVLVVSVAESDALPVFCRFMVVPAAVYDALVSGTEWLHVDANKVEFSISGATLTVLKPDDSTTDYTKTLTTDGICSRHIRRIQAAMGDYTTEEKIPGDSHVCAVARSRTGVFDI